MEGRLEEALESGPRRRGRVLLSYLITGAALAILRVALLMREDYAVYHGRTTIDRYFRWGLYPEELLGGCTRLGLIYFAPSSCGYFLFWGSIVVLVSFVLATPVLLVGWLTRRRR